MNQLFKVFWKSGWKKYRQQPVWFYARNINNRSDLYFETMPTEVFGKEKETVSCFHWPREGIWSSTESWMASQKATCAWINGISGHGNQKEFLYIYIVTGQGSAANRPLWTEPQVESARPIARNIDRRPDNSERRVLIQEPKYANQQITWGRVDCQSSIYLNTHVL